MRIRAHNPLFSSLRLSRRHAIVYLCLLVSAVAPWFLVAHYNAKTWAVGEVSVAFWAWQSQAPSPTDVQNAINEVHAKELFIRSGQIDYVNGKLKRIRPTIGKYPAGININLVYNATGDFLNSFGTIPPVDLAITFADLYRQDSARAAVDGADVVGIQLDLDVPTRLLGEYTLVLRDLRKSLSRTVISITGLPSWMESPQLKKTLVETDFWVPQCYGARIPERMDQEIPIASPAGVAQTVRRVRQLDHPFYAGLAAYGYAIHYSGNGRILELGGDLDPKVIVTNHALEQIGPAPRIGLDIGDIRYRYRAIEDCTTGSMQLRKGELLVLDVPTEEGLRASIRAVLENAGSMLRAICLFRLPSKNDPTTLSLSEIESALADRPPVNSLEATLTNESTTGAERLSIRNNGSASSVLGSVRDNALNVTLAIPLGTLASLQTDDILTAKAMCAVSSDGVTPNESLVPCSPRRANRIQLSSPNWRSGDEQNVVMLFNQTAPQQIPITISINNGDGRIWQDKRILTVDEEVHK